MRRRITLLVAVALLLALAITACGSPSIPGKVTLVSLQGEEQEITLAQLVKDVGSVSGEGGFMKSTGTIVGPGEYEGIPILPLLEKTVGFAEGNALEVVATDGYVMTYGYLQVTGQFMTYTSDSKPLAIGSATMILAYKEDGKTGFEGAPRVALIGEGAPFTDGHFWVRDVAEMRVISGVSEWELNLTGMEDAVIDRNTFQSIATCTQSIHPALTYEVKDSDGTHTYEGVPLWILVSTVDGGDEADGHFRFNDDLARQGYTVRLISSDGNEVELSSMDVWRNKDVALAYTRDGGPLPENEFPLRLVGPLLPSADAMIGGIERIELANLP